MGCLSKISFFCLLILIFVLVGIGLTKGLQYMASENYAPGDSPHSLFKLAVEEKNNEDDKTFSYGLYNWEGLEEIKNRTPSPIFFLHKSTASFQDPNGAHVILKVLAEKEEEQVIEVNWFDADTETVSRYRAKQGEITPFYFRRVSSGLAKRGFIISFMVMTLSAVPLYRLLVKAEKLAS